MNQIEVSLNGIDPTTFFGVQHLHISILQRYFPKLKIVARGDVVKASGEEEILTVFEQKIQLILDHIITQNHLGKGVLEALLLNEPVTNKNNCVLLFGARGKKICPQTPNQEKMVATVQKNDLVFASGPAGTGKTYMAVTLAVKALKNKEIQRIILTRPAVESGEQLGFLPGDLKEKLDPYMQPLYDALKDMIPHEKLQDYLEKSIIQIAPLAFMRGRTLANAYVILDEAQNTTEPQMKMFLTRMGKNAKFIVTGDPGQIDLPRKITSGFEKVIQLLQKIKGIGVVRLSGKDVIRHSLVGDIIEAYQKQDKTLVK